jgi:hypothetical protein
LSESRHGFSREISQKIENKEMGMEAFASVRAMAGFVGKKRLKNGNPIPDLHCFTLPVKPA